MRLIFTLLMFCLTSFCSIASSENHATLQVSIHESDPIRCMSGYGRLYAIENGGQPPYTYVWSSGGNQDTIDVYYPPQLYTVTVFDALGDSAVASFLNNYYPMNSYDIDSRVITECSASGMSAVQFGLGVYNGPIDDILIDYNSSGFYNTIITSKGVNCYLPGNYSISMQNWGCTVTKTFNVPTHTPKQLSYTSTGSCINLSNGTFTIHNVTGTIFERGWYVNNPQLIIRNSSGSVVQTRNVGFGFPDQNYPIEFGGLPAGNDYILIRSSSEGTATLNCSNCYDTIATGIIIPQLPDSCGIVSGRVYLDQNLDCIKNGSEYAVPNAIVSFSPGNVIANTNSLGLYSAMLPFGTYSATWSTPLSSSNTCPLPANFNLTNVNSLVTLDLADTVSSIPDKNISLASGVHRVGFNTSYSIRIENLTGNSVSGNIIDFYFDPILSFVNSNVNPSLNQPGHLRWTSSALNLSPYQSKLIQITLSIPPNPALTGTNINTSATINAALNEVNLANNTATYSATIVSSFDPNEKRVIPAGTGAQGLISPSQDLLKYIVDFQNTGNDTAINVMIIDTLSSYIDPLSFRAGPSSHSYRVVMSGERVLKFYFDNIYLPDSTTNEAKSHGFVSYSVRLKPNLPPGTEIRNTAHNVFDFNLPVATNTVINTIDLTTSQAGNETENGVLIFPNPANEVLYIRTDITSTVHALMITDITGKRLLYELTQDMHPFEKSIDISGLSAGLYFLRIETTQGKSIHKFIKRKE